MHSHRCKECNTVWHHSNDMKGNVDAHRCPNCGKQEWEQFNHASDPLPGAVQQVLASNYRPSVEEKIEQVARIILASVLLVTVATIGAITVLRAVKALREEVGA